MITVFIWNFRGKNIAWGHAAVRVGKTYMSWWPEPDGRRPAKISQNIYSAGPFRNRTYGDDVDAERQEADHAVQIVGLAENAIRDWWQSFGLVRDGVLYQGPLQAWETLSLNCSTVAAHALTIGGGETFAPWYRTKKIVWTPTDVHQYALAINSGISGK